MKGAGLHSILGAVDVTRGFLRLVPRFFRSLQNKSLKTFQNHVILSPYSFTGQGKNHIRNPSGPGPGRFKTGGGYSWMGNV